MTDEAISPLRQRMIEDMTIRKFAPKTQHDYVQRVKHFAASSAARPIPPASKTYAAISFIWQQVGPVFRPSTKASRHCGSFSGSRLGAATS